MPSDLSEVAELIAEHAEPFQWGKWDRHQRRVQIEKIEAALKHLDTYGWRIVHESDMYEGFD